jgi:hypothetical protein
MDGDRAGAINTALPDAPGTLKIRTLQCPGCGAPLSVRGLEQTQSLACGSCGSIIDITDENLRIITTFQSKIKYQPLIPLGTRGKLRGDAFEAIGYMRRQITVEGVDYEWSEYLLFNPYKGFRWLSEYNGHWSDIKVTTQIPKRQREGAFSYLGRTFLHFQTAEARVSYVLGEFYWLVEVGEICQVSDFVSPPFILSFEQTEAEATWSIGEYIEPAVIWKAFGLKSSVPPKVGIAPNQPSKLADLSGQIWKWWGIFLLVAFLVQMIFLLLSGNRLVFQDAFAFHLADKEKSRVTEIFELTGRPSNVVVRSKADVNNSWIYLNLALINEETGNAYDFGREISYYHGRDGGEAWSEGSPSDEAVLPSIPAGRYYLRIEPEAEVASLNYSVQIYRDVPSWTFFFLTLVGLSVFPIFYWWRRRTFEYYRWSESDHPMRSLSSYVSRSSEE